MTVLSGGQPVLHRLALALEIRDALTSRPITAPVAVRREDSRRQLTGSGGRFLLLFGPGIRDEADLRVTDATRQVVPRRFRIPLWSLADVEAADQEPPGPYIQALSRLLRVWLSPGRPPARAGVHRDPGPGRAWDRAGPLAPDRARGPGGVIVGRAHGDERGEFLLPVTGSGATPPPVRRRSRSTC